MAAAPSIPPHIFFFLSTVDDMKVDWNDTGEEAMDGMLSEAKRTRIIAATRDAQRRTARRVQQSFPVGSVSWSGVRLTVTESSQPSHWLNTSQT